MNYTGLPCDSNGYWYGMGMGTVMNPHGPVRILLRFSNGCEIKRKRVKLAINVVSLFEFRRIQPSL